MRDPTIPKSKQQRSRYALAAILLLLSAALLYALRALQIVPAPLLWLCYGLVIGSLCCGYQALARPDPSWIWTISVAIMILGYMGFMQLGVGWAADAMLILLGGAIIVAAVQSYRFQNWLAQEFTPGEWYFPRIVARSWCLLSKHWDKKGRKKNP